MQHVPFSFKCKMFPEFPASLPLQKLLMQGSKYCYITLMNENEEKRIAASLAKIMVMMCVRNTQPEKIHAGVVPISKTGDFSDVMGHL